MVAVAVAVAVAGVSGSVPVDLWVIPVTGPLVVSHESSLV